MERTWYYHLWTTPYSPQLNLIEILWRFIKYKWIDIDAYSSWETFVASVEKFSENLEKLCN